MAVWVISPLVVFLPGNELTSSGVSVDVDGHTAAGAVPAAAPQPYRPARRSRAGPLRRHARVTVLGDGRRPDRPRRYRGRPAGPGTPAAGAVRDGVRQRLVRHPAPGGLRLAGHARQVDGHRHVQPQVPGPPGRWCRHRMGPVRADRRTPSPLLVPAAVPPGSESPPVELVRFVRDEMANLAWAIEAVIEGPDGRGHEHHPTPPTSTPYHRA